MWNVTFSKSTLNYINNVPDNWIWSANHVIDILDFKLRSDHADRWYVTKNTHVKKDHVDRQHVTWNYNIKDHVDSWHVTGIITAEDHDDRHHVTDITAT